MLVALGGALGSMARFGLAGAVNRLVPSSFLFGTFVVNVLGCFVFGVIVAIADERYAIGPDGRAFLLVGILGGFTTFSSFSYETFALMREGLALRASLNVVGQVVLGLAGVWAGYLTVGVF
jgi:CrcB protein